MSISREEVEHIALLSRLDLSEEELERYSRELDQILGHVEKISELNTDDVPPTSHPIPIVNVFRADKVAPSLPNEEALQNAPDASPPFYRVPRIVD